MAMTSTMKHTTETVMMTLVFTASARRDRKMIFNTWVMRNHLPPVLWRMSNTVEETKRTVEVTPKRVVSLYITDGIPVLF